jgi:hypothetical protein
LVIVNSLFYPVKRQSHWIPGLARNDRKTRETNFKIGSNLRQSLFSPETHEHAPDNRSKPVVAFFFYFLIASTLVAVIASLVLWLKEKKNAWRNRDRD